MTAIKAIHEVIYGKVAALGASLNIPVSYPGVNFTAPNAGRWLELIVLPNGSLNQPINSHSTPLPKGLFRVNVCTADPNGGSLPLFDTADTVAAAFPLGLPLLGHVVRIGGWPEIDDLMVNDGVMRVPVRMIYTS